MQPITIEGNLTDEPRVNQHANSENVTFTVASSDSKYNQDMRQWETKNTMFMRVTVWGQQAHNCMQSLHKGMNVVVVGKLSQYVKTSQSGEKVTYTSVNADTVAVSLKRQTAQVTKSVRQQASQQQWY